MSCGKITDLMAWQLARLPAKRAAIYASSSFPAVSAVVYHFWSGTQLDTQFPYVESAIFETWRWCGRLKTNLVVNQISPAIAAFAESYSGSVSVHINPKLIPGNVPSMSLDCNMNLYRYFDTEYVLVIQNDGFPLRSGLEEFVGRYDYIGAPFIRNTRLNRTLGFWPYFAVGNGGFSLRTKHICEMASFYWRKRYHWLPTSFRLVREDAFYCFVLPFFERSFRTGIRFATIEEARHFSYDNLYGETLEALPFGFHGAKTFQELCEKGLMND